MAVKERTYATDFYTSTQALMRSIVVDMRILAGDDVGPSDVSWQDVAGTLHTNLAVLAARVQAARTGRQRGTIVWPSIDEITAHPTSELEGK